MQQQVTFRSLGHFDIVFPYWLFILKGLWWCIGLLCDAILQSGSSGSRLFLVFTAGSADKTTQCRAKPIYVASLRGGYDISPRTWTWLHTWLQLSEHSLAFIVPAGTHSSCPVRLQCFTLLEPSELQLSAIETDHTHSLCTGWRTGIEVDPYSSCILTWL